MDQRVDAVIAFMKTNLHRKLTPIEIARSVRLSPAHLRELFKDETGTSLTRYRRELRLDRAKHLLETTFLSVKEVAASVGIDGSAISLGILKRNMERRRVDTQRGIAARTNQQLQRETRKPANKSAFWLTRTYSNTALKSPRLNPSLTEVEPQQSK